jgi:hypothetical protein
MASYPTEVRDYPTGEYSEALTDLKNSVMRVADVTITSAQLLALNATPQSLLAAPGAGKANIVLGVQMFLDYNSAAYVVDAADDIGIRYTDGSGQLIATVETNGFLTATADAYRYTYPASTAAITPVANAAIVAHMGGTEVITGNSPLKVRVFYTVVDLAF